MREGQAGRAFTTRELQVRQVNPSVRKPPVRNRRPIGSGIYGTAVLSYLSESSASGGTIKFFKKLEKLLAKVNSTLLLTRDGIISAYHLKDKKETGEIGKLTPSRDKFDYVSLPSSVFEGNGNPFAHVDSLLEGASAIPPRIPWTNLDGFKSYTVQMGRVVDPTIVRLTVVMEPIGGKEQSPMKIDLIRAALVCGEPLRKHNMR